MNKKPLSKVEKETGMRREENANKRHVLCILLCILIICTSCSAATERISSFLNSSDEPGTDDSKLSADVSETTTDESGVRLITAQEAKEMMDTLSGYVIVDVREQYEFDAGHIEGAVLIPLGSIEQLAGELIPDKESVLLVYCRSGRRSAAGAQILFDMGYKNVYDFGGIISWPYEVVAAEGAA